jgi:opacity protein-like surface antigen
MSCFGAFGSLQRFTLLRRAWFGLVENVFSTFGQSGGFRWSASSNKTMKNVTQRFLAIVLALAASGNCARAGFYLRPLIQFGQLSGEYADTSPAVGGGLALGAAFGGHHGFEVGAEVTTIRYGGFYNEPTAYQSWPVPLSLTPIAWKRVPATYDVTPILATFRYSFVTQNEKLRPFLGVAAGLNLVKISTPNLSDDGFSFTAGLGGGVSYRLGRGTMVEISYRYVTSDDAGDFAGTYHFEYIAHTVAIALDQRF